MKIFRQDKQAFQATTFTDSISLVDENKNPVSLASSEKLIFTVKSHYSADYIIKRVFTSSDTFNGEFPINITPEELDIPPGRYFYDVRLQKTNGDFVPIVPKSLFDVLETESRKEVD